MVGFSTLQWEKSYYVKKGLSSQSYVFSSSHVWMWELDHKESWVLKNWCFWTVVLEMTLKSPLDCKEMEPVNPKGNQLWIFIRRTKAEVDALKLWPPDVKSWLIRKDPDAGKDWRQEKRTTEDEMAGWHHRLIRREFEQAPGGSEGRGSLTCCSPRGRKESDRTEQLNNHQQHHLTSGNHESALHETLESSKTEGFPDTLFPD